MLVALACVEFLISLRLPARREPRADVRFELKPYLRMQYLRNNLGVLNANSAIWLSIVGLATFWAISQVMLAAFPAFAKETLQVTSSKC